MHHATLSSMLDPDLLRPERVRPLRRVEYERLVETGVLDDERVELLHGSLVEMSPQGAPHATLASDIAAHFIRVLGKDFKVRTHCALALTEYSEPEPDVAVVAAGNYYQEHPTTALLVIEVAESSLRKDRRVKGPLYASVGIPEYWIVDVAGGQIEVHTRPGGGAYTESRIVRRGDTLSLAAIAGVTVAVSDVLPPEMDRPRPAPPKKRKRRPAR
jgi:Uma2 family endonuclease